MPVHWVIILITLFISNPHKFKSLDKKKKMRKEDSVIIKTVRDNLKAFVDYKSSRQLNNK